MYSFQTYDDISMFFLVDTDKSSAKVTKVCDAPCYSYNSCENCTQNYCMWCGSQERCVETNSYVASFLYGQCLEWVTNTPKCPGTDSNNV